MTPAAFLVQRDLDRHARELHAWVSQVRSARDIHTAFSRAMHMPARPPLARFAGGSGASRENQARVEVERILEGYIAAREAGGTKPVLSARERHDLLRKTRGGWPRLARRLQVMRVSEDG